MKRDRKANKQRTPALGLIAAAAFLGAPWIAPALAQDIDDHTDAQEEPAFTENTVRQFAQAAVHVQAIGQEYHPQLQVAETDTERNAIRQQASDKMVAAIQQQGISLEVYNQIAAAARTNPELDHQISRLMDDVK